MLSVLTNFIIFQIIVTLLLIIVLLQFYLRRPFRPEITQIFPDPVDPPPSGDVTWRCSNPLNQQWIQTVGDSATFNANCPAQYSNTTIVMHGFLQGPFTRWVPGLLKNFRTKRNSCTCLMDYSPFSTQSYQSLRVNYGYLLGKCVQFVKFLLQDLGYDPDKMWLWGHSFGSQIALGCGFLYSPSTIGRCDVCDPAGPGFPPLTFPTFVANYSAKTVQLIHTSSDNGTAFRYGPYNMNMGECGYYQAAATDSITSHGRCPDFYNISFEFDYVAVNRPAKCLLVPGPSPDVTNLPRITMGYTFNPDQIPKGNYFFPTYANYPFNQPPTP